MVCNYCSSITIAMSDPRVFWSSIISKGKFISFTKTRYGKIRVRQIEVCGPFYLEIITTCLTLASYHQPEEDTTNAWTPANAPIVEIPAMFDVEQSGDCKVMASSQHHKTWIRPWDWAKDLGQNMFIQIDFNSARCFVSYNISHEICTRFLLCCALLWLYIDWFSHIH